MTILLTAILPALAVLLIAGVTRNRFWTWMAAFAAGAFGVVHGRSQYLVLDLAAVAVALWMSLTGLKGRSLPVVAQQPPLPALTKEKAFKGLGVAGLFRLAAAEGLRVTTLFALFAAVVIAFNFFSPSTVAPDPSQAQLAAPGTAVMPMSEALPTKALPPADRPSKQSRPRVTPTRTQDQSAAASKAVQRPNPSPPIEQCLSIPSEAGMSRCLERLK